MFVGNNQKIVEDLQKEKPRLQHRNIYKNLLDLIKNDTKVNDKSVKKTIPILILNAYLETDTTDIIEISHGDEDISPERHHHFIKTPETINGESFHKNNINVKSLSGHIVTTQEAKSDLNQSIIPIWDIYNIESMSMGAIDVTRIPNNKPLLSKRNQILTQFSFNHLIFSPFTLITEDEFWSYLIKLQKGLTYALKNLSPPSDKEIETKKINLSPRDEGN